MGAVARTDVSNVKSHPTAAAADATLMSFVAEPGTSKRARVQLEDSLIAIEGVDDDAPGGALNAGRHRGGCDVL